MTMGPFKDGWQKQDIEAVIERNDPDELLYAPIVVAMDPPESAWVESVCVRLSSHVNQQVRANAVLGFGHLARTCRCLDKTTVLPIIVTALSDPDDSVRGQARCAADDIRQFLGWDVSEPSQ